MDLVRIGHDRELNPADGAAAVEQSLALAVSPIHQRIVLCVSRTVIGFSQLPNVAVGLRQHGHPTLLATTSIRRLAKAQHVTVGVSDLDFDAAVKREVGFLPNVGARL